jgi:hypothetical protein
LHLIEGNAPRAAVVLASLADSAPANPRWAYCASWAAALTGNAASMERRLSALEASPGAWTVAALLLDSAPALAERHELDAMFGGGSARFPGPPKEYLEVARMRLALARHSRSQRLGWKPRGGPLEQELEALRTILGHAFHDSDRAAFARALSMPVFLRLPLADQLFWRGLHALLNKDPFQARALLDQAAGHGHRRAALVLAVHLAKQGNISEARQFLARGGADRADAKVQLLRAELDAREGLSESAARALDRLAAGDDRRANYALGGLYWLRAQDAHRAGRPDLARTYWQQAAAAFTAALKTGLIDPPDDCELFARCAEFVASPARGLEAWARLWDRVERLPAGRSRPWLLWNAVVARLWSDKLALSQDVIQAIVELAETAGRVPPAAAETVVQALARHCLAASAAKPSDEMVPVVEQLASRSADAQLHRWRRLVVAASLRRRYSAGTIRERDRARQQIAALARLDPGNGLLALLGAEAHLAVEPHTARSILAAARPETPIECQWCESLLDLLEGRAPAAEKLPKARPDDPAPLARASDLLRAAAGFAAGSEQGYAALLAVLRQGSDDWKSMLDSSSSLPALCAQAAKGRSVPLDLVEAVRQFKSNRGNAPQTLTIARCAAAIGEADVACRLWEETLAGDQNQASRQEYLKYLCHLGVTASKAGKWADASKWLERAEHFARES